MLATPIKVINGSRCGSRYLVVDSFTVNEYKRTLMAEVLVTFSNIKRFPKPMQPY